MPCAEFAALLGVAIDSNLPSPDIDEAREAVRAYTNGAARTPADAALEAPTDTEQKVLERLAAGMTVEEVADDLHLGKSTIKNSPASHSREAWPQTQIHDLEDSYRIPSPGAGWPPEPATNLRHGAPATKRM